MRRMPKSAVRVAREALAAGRAALPEYGSRYSRRDYTQPQLFALLVLRQFLRTDYGASWRSSPNGRSCGAPSGLPRRRTTRPWRTRPGES